MDTISPLLGYYWSPGADDPARALELLDATRANVVVVPGQSLGQISPAALAERGVRLIADWTVFAGEDLRQRFPDSVPVDASGQPYDRDGWYVPACPNHPALRAAQLDALAHLLARHGEQLFGLWLDFIRFPVRWEGASPPLPQTCFCRHCLNLFLGETRASYSVGETSRLAYRILAERRAAWEAWRCDCITTFTQEVRRLIDAHAPALQMGIFCLPWRQGDFAGALRAVAGQDLGQLARQVDCFSPMVYHRLCGQDVAWIGDVILDVQQHTQGETPRRVLPIVQAMDRPDPLPPQELEQALAACRVPDGAGALIFTLATVQEDSAKVAAVRRRFA